MRLPPLFRLEIGVHSPRAACMLLYTCASQQVPAALVDSLRLQGVVSMASGVPAEGNRANQSTSEPVRIIRSELVQILQWEPRTGKLCVAATAFRFRDASHVWVESPSGSREQEVLLQPLAATPNVATSLAKRLETRIRRVARRGCDRLQRKHRGRGTCGDTPGGDHIRPVSARFGE